MSAPARTPTTPPPAVTQPGARPGPPSPGKLKAVRKRPAQAAAAPAKERGTTTATPTRRPGRARPAVGNAATAALAARGAQTPTGRDQGKTPGRPVVGKKAAAPGLRRIAAQVTAGKRILTRHPAPAAEAAAAQRAAAAPPGERAAFAGQDQAAAIASAQAKPFGRAEFIAKFEKRIKEQQPATADEAKALADPARPDTLTPQLSGEVHAAADASSGEVRATAATPPDPARVPERPAVPLSPDRPPPVPAPPRAADAVPAPVPVAAVDLSAHASGTTADMDKAGLTDETLQRANEPAFTAALQSKKAAEKDSAAAPGSFRAKEAEQRAAAEHRAAAAGKTAMAAMAGVRAATGKSVAGGKQAAQAGTETRRAAITKQLTDIYEVTKRNVEAALAGLDDTVRTLFDDRAGQARKRFLAACEKSWWDFFSGEPDYAKHSAAYTAEIRGVVDEIATVVEKRVNDARQKAADGRRRMADFVAGLEPAMRGFGEQTAAGFAAKFDELEASIDEKADAVVDQLAESYAQAQEATNAALAEVKESNKGLWERARDAVVGAIKILIDLKNLLVGVVKRAAGVAERIIKDPIRFLSNLGASVKAGLAQFLSNIVKHLKAALQEWLFGNLAAAGVELPEQWDLRGIVKMVLSLFGISWAFIRSELLKHMPESVLNTVIGAIKVIGVIRDKGVGGLWEEIKEKIGDLKQQAFEMIKGFVVETVLKAGITWLLSLITPAGALVKAVMAVYDFVTFLVEKARALAEFVNSILDTLEEICNGVSQKVATKIEDSLARTLPLAIDLLARVLRLGAIPAKIKSVLEKVGAPVRGFISKMIATAAAYGKKLLTGGKKALGKLVGKADRRTPEEKRRDVQAAVELGVTTVNKLEGTLFDGKTLKAVLLAIRIRYRLKSLEPVEDDGVWSVEGSLSPKKKQKTKKKAKRASVGRPAEVQYGPPDMERPKWAKAKISVETLGGQTDPSVDPPGWESDKGLHRSHLIAANLGGSNSDSLNFVALYARANHPGMTRFERKVRNKAESGEVVTYRVEAVYKKNFERITKATLRPISVEMKATWGKNNTRLFETNVPNKKD
ncbi:DNA/RNA non-specific endonuclease [Streptomyces sp. NBC_00879]|uniref:DNA/RNA non-specific endonuclease n=1 Tax=Streptomyces sp. NBC_00879 TaxID=2975855 RepID=UPI00386E269A|nr:DNA/RNA non-specific endonuclease [Streptomyces sp. NBC_00879]